MALVLTLRVNEGFYVQDTRFTVSAIHSETEIELTQGAKVTVLNERRSVEVMPDVFLSVGGRGQLGLTRIAIEAPRSIPVLREAMWIENQRGTPRK